MTIRICSLLSLTATLLLTGCGSPRQIEKLRVYPAYETVIPSDRVSEAAAWVTATLATQVSKAEDTEDNIVAAKKAALEIFGVATWGLRTERNGLWEFTPYERLSLSERAICDEDRKP